MAGPDPGEQAEAQPGGHEEEEVRRRDHPRVVATDLQGAERGPAGEVIPRLEKAELEQTGDEAEPGRQDEGAARSVLFIKLHR